MEYNVHISYVEDLVFPNRFTPRHLKADNPVQLINTLHTALHNIPPLLPVREICIVIQDPKSFKDQEYKFYIAENIHTDYELANLMSKKYGYYVSMPRGVGEPAVLTSVYNERQCMIGRPDKHGKINIDWHVLDPNKDIVLDKNLYQIYPEKTKQFPTDIQNLLGGSCSFPIVTHSAVQSVAKPKPKQFVTSVAYRVYESSVYNGSSTPKFQTESIIKLFSNMRKLVNTDAYVYKLNVHITDPNSGYISEHKRHSVLWRQYYTNPFGWEDEQYDFYIADSIHTDYELADLMSEKYGKDICQMPTVVNKPAILTRISDTDNILGGLYQPTGRSNRLRDFIGLRPSRNRGVHGGPGTRHVNVGKTIGWHVLAQDDIVLNRDLCQIYPTNLNRAQTLMKIRGMLSR